MTGDNRILRARSADSRPAPFDPRRNLVFLENGVYLGRDLGQKLLVHLAPALYLAPHFLVGLGLKVPEGQVLELAADLAHAEAMGDGSVDFERLSRDALALFRRQRVQRPHVVQPIRQLHQHHADVVHHG